MMRQLEQGGGTVEKAARAGGRRVPRRNPMLWPQPLEPVQSLGRTCGLLMWIPATCDILETPYVLS